MSKATPDSPVPVVDENVARQAQFHEKEALEHLKVHADYGRWILASLLIINSGALFGMFNSARAVQFLSSYAHWALLGGVAAAILSGQSARVNWASHYAEAEIRRQWWSFGGERDYAAEIAAVERKQKWSNIASFGLAILSGFSTIVAFVMISTSF